MFVDSSTTLSRPDGGYADFIERRRHLQVRTPATASTSRRDGGDQIAEVVIARDARGVTTSTRGVQKTTTPTTPSQHGQAANGRGAGTLTQQ